MSDSISIHYESKEVQKNITDLLKKVERPKKLVASVARYINSVTKQMFSGRRPDVGGRRGVKWPKLKQSTINRKKQLKRKGKLTGGASPSRPMVASGDLRDSLRVLDIKEKGLKYGTLQKSKKGFPYPGYHNIGRFPFLFLNKTDNAQIIKMTLDYLEGKLESFKKYVKR